MAAKRKIRGTKSPGKKSRDVRPKGPHLYLVRTGECIPITHSGPRVQFEAVNWSYLIRNRSRWAYDNANQAHELVGRAIRLVRLLLETSLDANGKPQRNPDKDVLRRLAMAGMIEVSLPFTTESEGWEYRILPWEYLLSAATQGQESRPTPVRRPPSASGGPNHPHVGQTLCAHQAAPPALRQTFDFDSERALTRITAEFAKATFNENKDRLEDPTPQEIKSSLRQAPPMAIHVSGFDSWQAAAELKDDLSARLTATVICCRTRSVPLGRSWTAEISASC